MNKVKNVNVNSIDKKINTMDIISITSINGLVASSIVLGSFILSKNNNGFIPVLFMTGFSVIDYLASLNKEKLLKVKENTLSNSLK